MTTAKRVLGASVVLAAGLAMSACGGDSSPNAPVTTPVPPVTAQVPASASASIAGFIAYLNALVISFADLLDPVDISTVTPPVDETSDPTPLT